MFHWRKEILEQPNGLQLLNADPSTRNLLSWVSCSQSLISLAINTVLISLRFFQKVYFSCHSIYTTVFGRGTCFVHYISYFEDGGRDSTLVIYIKLHGVTLQNTINLYRNCCEIFKYSKPVPTFLEIVLFPRNGTANKVTEHTIHVNVAAVWSDPFIRLSLDRLNRRTERTKQYYKRCPCRCVSDRQTDRQKRGTCWMLN